MFKLYSVLIMLMLVMAADPEYGEAATPITLAATGASTYSISVIDLPESAGMDLSITYNKEFLKDPVVAPGLLAANAMMVPNIATPGFIRIGIITGGSIKGTGVIASISFTKIADAAPLPILAPPSVYSASGTQLAVQSTASDSAQLPVENKKNDEGTKNSTVTIPAVDGSGTAIVAAGAVPSSVNPATAQGPITIGTVSLPQEPAEKKDSSPVKDRSEETNEQTPYRNVSDAPAAAAAGGKEPAAAADTKPPAVRSTLKSIQSVSDRFRLYKDIRTLKKFSALFDESALNSVGIVQRPAVVVTDGKALVTVTIELVGEADTPSFSLKGANLKSIRQLSANKWELVALPQKAKADVRVSIIRKGGRAEIPLIAVPSLNLAGAAIVARVDAALDQLLAKPILNNRPAYDLNADGRQDYLDDYILVAHWLLKQQHSKNKAGRSPAAAGK